MFEISGNQIQHHQHLPSIETKNLFQTQLKIFLKLFLLSSFHLKCLTAAVDPSFKEGGWMSCKNPEGNMERQICRISYILPKNVNQSIQKIQQGHWILVEFQNFSRRSKNWKFPYISSFSCLAPNHQTSSIMARPPS